MEDSKRKAYIKQQAAAKKKQERILPPKTGLAHPSTKWQPSKKLDRQAKKPKVVTGLAAEKTSGPFKLLTTLSPGKGKGLKVSPDPVKEKPLVLLCEDSQYALKQITSIIKDEDYEDLGNHAIEAMGETGQFNLAQVCIRHNTFLSCLFIIFLISAYGWCRGS